MKDNFSSYYKKLDKQQKEAMDHPDELGAGAAKRRKLPPQKRFPVVIAEYLRGTLNSGSGHKVKSLAQARAIARSESKTVAKDNKELP
jgi:hypothetical protein